MKEYTIDINDLKQDDLNFNVGTYEGSQLIEKSFKKFGAGRSVLLDENNNLIAGNKSAEIAIKCGIKKVRVIETDGNELVVVKRTDISLDSQVGRELAMADNATSAMNIAYDLDNLNRAMEDLPTFDIGEWGVSSEDLGKAIESKGEINIDDFEELQELKVKLTPLQYEQVTSKLKLYGEDFANSLLTILGYYEDNEE